MKSGCICGTNGDKIITSIKLKLMKWVVELEPVSKQETRFSLIEAARPTLETRLQQHFHETSAPCSEDNENQESLRVTFLTALEDFRGDISSSPSFTLFSSQAKDNETTSPQQGDLRLSGPPSGQGAGSGARTRDRRVPADLRADSQATVLPTPLS
ncbi:hypothetical protein PoB_003135000 [Plakobranchus ocellatus]|uniref:Uncharacterized protein n=1 Tax=Plakobranchus ocellatus TaxID=259542 RepID=A0AAV4ADH8_9GAST|nr:hypothetical protein PoB_003135000 [Plakobranchus ocellatus]